MRRVARLLALALLVATAVACTSTADETWIGPEIGATPDPSTE